MQLPHLPRRRRSEKPFMQEMNWLVAPIDTAADIRPSMIPLTIVLGAISFVLHSIGRMNTPTPSKELRGYGESGAGRWITVYASEGHSFPGRSPVCASTPRYGGANTGRNGLLDRRPADWFVMSVIPTEL